MLEAGAGGGAGSGEAAFSDATTMPSSRVIPGERTIFERAAREEAANWRTLAERRFAVVDAFYRELRGEVPAGGWPKKS